MRLFIALAFVVGSLVPVASRADSPTSPTLAEIRTQQLEYRSQAERKSGPFKEMPSHEVSELLRKQGRVLTLTEGKQSLDELAPDAKVEVINSLEWIKASIAKVDNERGFWWSPSNHTLLGIERPARRPLRPTPRIPSGRARTSRSALRPCLAVSRA